MTAAVLLVGCGNIGFRHLQALCAMPTPSAITVIEPNSVHHERIRNQFTDARTSAHTFELHERLPPTRSTYDLVVVATGSMHRRAAVDDVLDHHEVSAMVLEKVLFQTTGDLEAIGARLAEGGVRSFVNCGRRTFPGYQELRVGLLDDRPIDVTVRGASFGLASNAIHFLDLAEFLNEADVVSVDAAGLDPGSVPARHPGCIDVFGTLSATLSNGAELVVECLDDQPQRIAVEIRAGDRRIVIDELARTVTADDGTVAPFRSQNVSETFWLYDDALRGADPTLTPYVDSARQHRLFLDALRDHLGVSVTDDEPCPIS